MGVLNFISSSFHRRDEEPDKRLAEEIVRKKAADWVKELIDNLSNEDKNIQSDCIKVLCEIGELGAADLVASYVADLTQLLNSKNNRMVWGGMSALDTIAPVNPTDVFGSLSQVVEAID